MAVKRNAEKGIQQKCRTVQRQNQKIIERVQSSKGQIRRSGEGNARVDFPHFDAMDSVFGDCPSVTPIAVYESAGNAYFSCDVVDDDVETSSLSVHSGGSHVSDSPGFIPERPSNCSVLACADETVESNMPSSASHDTKTAQSDKRKQPTNHLILNQEKESVLVWKRRQQIWQMLPCNWLKLEGNDRVHDKSGRSRGEA